MYIFVTSTIFHELRSSPFWLILCIKGFLVISCAESQLPLSSDIQAVIRITWIFQALSLSTVIIIHLQQLWKHKTRRVVYVSAGAACWDSILPSVKTDPLTANMDHESSLQI